MGLDFNALILYGSLSPSVVLSIELLERGERAKPLADVVACGARRGWAFASNTNRDSIWRSRANWDEKLPQRPILPSLACTLELPSQFFLTFGSDAACLYHVLRWHAFLTEIEWQQVMLAAVKYFCQLLSAKDCIVTNDEHPSLSAFHSGALFHEALESSVQHGQGEVPRIGDLYIEVEDDADIAIKPPDGSTSEFKGLGPQLMDWPREKPLPDGWLRPTTWDTKGYWRFTWA
jgi:hypothetical protein